MAAEIEVIAATPSPESVVDKDELHIENFVLTKKKFFLKNINFLKNKFVIDKIHIFWGIMSNEHTLIYNIFKLF